MIILFLSCNHVSPDETTDCYFDIFSLLLATCHHRSLQYNGDLIISTKNIFAPSIFVFSRENDLKIANMIINHQALLSLSSNRKKVEKRLSTLSRCYLKLQAGESK